MNAKKVDALTEAPQEFIDAVFIHNGRPAPRARDIAPPPPMTGAQGEDISQLKPLLSCIPADCGYDDWTRAQMAAHHETGGSDAGFRLVDEWSSKGSKYPGTEVMKSNWRS